MRCLLPLTCLLLSACTERTASLEFSAEFEGRTIDCASAFPALNDLRFYVSEIRVSAAGGLQKPVAISEVDGFQSRHVALVDLENGEGGCDGGTPETRHELALALPRGDYDTLSMTIGVPFEFNHQNPLLAAAPLDDPAMHWHWRSGYKFLRAGIATERGVSWLHLGSTGCEGVTSNITGCQRPNRLHVSLPLAEALENGITIRMHELFDGTGEAFDCSSGPMETSCSALWAPLGLKDADSTQSVFAVRQP